MILIDKKKSKKSFSVFGKLVRKFESGLGPGAKLTEYLLMLWRTKLDHLFGRYDVLKSNPNLKEKKNPTKFVKSQYSVLGCLLDPK